jgi:ATP-binding cassette subfamily F protein 3
VAQVVQKKPVNPHKLAAAEAKVAELEGALAELDRQLADRPTPMPPAWR